MVKEVSIILDCLEQYLKNLPTKVIDTHTYNSFAKEMRCE